MRMTRIETDPPDTLMYAVSIRRDEPDAIPMRSDYTAQTYKQAVSQARYYDGDFARNHFIKFGPVYF